LLAILKEDWGNRDERRDRQKKKTGSGNLFEKEKKEKGQSNLIDTGDHRGLPLQAFVEAGLRACAKILPFGRL
jgi:hypothetical protein